MKYADTAVRIEAVASGLHISSVYFQRAFKSRYGMPPSVYARCGQAPRP